MDASRRSVKTLVIHRPARRARARLRQCAHGFRRAPAHSMEKYISQAGRSQRLGGLTLAFYHQASML